MYSLVSKYHPSPGFSPHWDKRGEIDSRDSILLDKAGVASGIFKSFLIEKNIPCFCAAFNPKDDFHLHKLPESSEFFILRIDEISHAGNGLMMAGDRYNSGMYPKKQSVLLLSSLEEFTFFAPGDSRVETIEIMIPRRLFFSRLAMMCPYALLKKYMTIKSKKAQIGSGNPLFTNLFIKIMKDVNEKVSNPGCLTLNAASLLEIFFSELSVDLNNFLESEKIKISRDEIKRLIIVRKYLEISTPPPNFSSLTKIALMSSTSLKTKFKKMFGATIFEYYQSMRMQRARVLLLTHKYSVKEIGCQLGYLNMSNFTIAFKKEFNQLPHDLMKL
ncbi:MAG: helix-turn-helix transcriptional regulator [Ginsengibacter sp.]